MKDSTRINISIKIHIFNIIQIHNLNYIQFENHIYNLNKHQKLVRRNYTCSKSK